MQVLIACEKVRETDLIAAPDVDESVPVNSHRTLTLEALVRMKLNVFRDKDRMHVRDLLDVGLIDETWVIRFSPDLAQRLQQLIDTPEG